jgi:hypothetical protein
MVLTYNFRGFSLLSARSIAFRSMARRKHMKEWNGEESCSPLGTRKQRELGGGQGQDTLQRPAPSDLLPPASPHLIKYPTPPKITPPTGNQTFNT